MVNRVILIGYLGADPEIREIQGGAKVAKLRIATSENYRDKSGEWQKRTEWHQVVAWRQLADKCVTLTKGTPIYVEGKLTTRSWEKDGEKRYTTEVVADYFRSLPHGGEREQSEPTAESVPTYQPKNVATAPADDELPF